VGPGPKVVLVVSGLTFVETLLEGSITTSGGDGIVQGYPAAGCGYAIRLGSVETRLRFFEWTTKLKK
jgi:hypothetical protein